MNLDVMTETAAEDLEQIICKLSCSAKAANNPAEQPTFSSTWHKTDAELSLNHTAVGGLQTGPQSPLAPALLAGCSTH